MVRQAEVTEQTMHRWGKRVVRRCRETSCMLTYLLAEFSRCLPRPHLSGTCALQPLTRVFPVEDVPEGV
jgi:hypothetical protein